MENDVQFSHTPLCSVVWKTDFILPILAYIFSQLGRQPLETRMVPAVQCPEVQMTQIFGQDGPQAPSRYSRSAEDSLFWHENARCT